MWEGGGGGLETGKLVVLPKTMEKQDLRGFCCTCAQSKLSQTFDARLVYRSRADNLPHVHVQHFYEVPNKDVNRCDAAAARHLLGPFGA